MTRSIATPPGWDASPTQVILGSLLPPTICQVAQTIYQYSFVLLGGERRCESKAIVLSKKKTKYQDRLIDHTEPNALTIRTKPKRTHTKTVTGVMRGSYRPLGLYKLI